MASKSLILALALATTAGAKGIRGLNFGNYYDTCVTTDIEKENKCQDYSCAPGGPVGEDGDNCGDKNPAGKSACQNDPDCMWVEKSSLPSNVQISYNHDFCYAIDGEQPAMVDKKNMCRRAASRTCRSSARP